MAESYGDMRGGAAQSFGMGVHGFADAGSERLAVLIFAVLI
jgi:hypothetical protein